MNELKMRCALCMAFFVSAGTAFAQVPYFQQEVNYTISVRLDDRKHTLRGNEEIVYINHSPHQLDTIWMHLWPNAYKDRSTALSKQLLENGESALHFAEPDERGFIDSLNFKVDEQPVKWNLHPKHIDVAFLVLNQPLKSKGSIRISTPFFVKIPDAKFSRLGHTGEAYFITQWYPKPAVFDNKGWHPMPYLNQGEFYSEFGSFDVSITLPQNYLLAATGDRIDAADEEAFLEEKIAETKKHIAAGSRYMSGSDFPPSSPSFKTVRFRQYRVHDFAWFADKRFYVLKEQFELPGTKRVIDGWVFFTGKNFERWKKACEYVKDATVFYSRHLGDYPYNHVTALDGTIIAGGGMEYPNITVIGDASSDFELDMVITHEVGHNWFYGILASNEREHPFLDEGLNSLYEMRYVRSKYPTRTLATFIGRDSTFKLFGLNKAPLWKYHEISFFGALRNNSDQAMNLHSEKYSNANYGSIVYSKTALAFDYLLHSMGEENFDAAMKKYFEAYKFKHPGPDDLFKTLAGDKRDGLEWFRKNFYEATSAPDLKIKSAKKDQDGSWRIRIRDKSASGVPVPVYAYRDGVLAGEVWSISGGRTRDVAFPPMKADEFVIDPESRLPELNKRNNFIKTGGLFKRSRPASLRFLFAVEEPRKSQIAYVPLLGGNYYNGFMAGMAFHNYSLYPKRFEWLLAPMYGFKSRTPVGFAEANLNFFPASAFRMVTIGSKFKSFAYDHYNRTLDLSYYRVSPYLNFDFKKRDPRSLLSQSLNYTMHNVFYERGQLNLTAGVLSAVAFNDYYSVSNLRYRLKNDRELGHYSLQVNLEHNLDMAKLSGIFEYQLVLGRKHRADIRVFAGSFIAGTEANRARYAFRASGISGWQDYAFEGNYMARNERQGFGFSQFMDRDGAMKVYTPLGQTVNWLAAVNFTSPKIGKLPVKIFADVASCDGRALLFDKVLWDAGVQLVLWQDIIEFYFPLAYSEDIRYVLELNNIEWYNRFRFTLNIHKLDPKKILHSSLF